VPVRAERQLYLFLPAGLAGGVDLQDGCSYRTILARGGPAASLRVIQAVDTIDRPAKGAPFAAGSPGKAGNNGSGGRGHLFHTPVLIKEEDRYGKAPEKFINRQPVRPGKICRFFHLFSPAFKKWATQAYPTPGYLYRIFVATGISICNERSINNEKLIDLFMLNISER
jgi:hypothetical protein